MGGGQQQRVKFHGKTKLGFGESRKPLDEEINGPKIKCFGPLNVLARWPP